MAIGEPLGVGVIKEVWGMRILMLGATGTIAVLATVGIEWWLHARPVMAVVRGLVRHPEPPA